MNEKLSSAACACVCVSHSQWLFGRCAAVSPSLCLIHLCQTLRFCWLARCIHCIQRYFVAATCASQRNCHFSFLEILPHFLHSCAVFYTLNLRLRLREPCSASFPHSAAHFIHGISRFCPGNIQHTEVFRFIFVVGDCASLHPATWCEEKKSYRLNLTGFTSLCTMFRLFSLFFWGEYHFASRIRNSSLFKRTLEKLSAFGLCTVRGYVG